MAAKGRLVDSAATAIARHLAELGERVPVGLVRETDWLLSERSWRRPAKRRSRRRSCASTPAAA